MSKREPNKKKNLDETFSCQEAWDSLPREEKLAAYQNAREYTEQIKRIDEALAQLDAKDITLH